MLFIKRAQGTGRWGGALLFPGGKECDADRDIAWSALLASPLDDLSLRIAALREVFEETGLLLGQTVSAEATAYRRRVSEDPRVFLTLHQELGLTPACHILSPWARWITPSAEPRRYDTRFFLTCTERESTLSPVADGVEAASVHWHGPAALLAAYATDSEILLAPPTFRLLEELSELGSLAAIHAACLQRRVRPIMPKIAMLDERMTIVLPWDRDYQALEGEGLPERSEAGPTRITLIDGKWQCQEVRP